MTEKKAVLPFLIYQKDKPHIELKAQEQIFPIILQNSREVLIHLERPKDNVPIKNLYDDGKIGTSEQNLLRTTISKSLQIFNQLQVISEPKKNVVVIAADSQSLLLSEAASSTYHSDGWNVFHLGDMSSVINVLFDLDFQKLIGKVWKQKSGILIVVVFSQTDEGLNFFADSINPIKEKYGKHFRLALCGNISKNTKIDSDLFSEKFEDILQWSHTVSENMK